MYRRNIYTLLIFFFALATTMTAWGQVEDSLNRTDAEGRKQGLWRTYYKNGNLRSETIYRDGLKNGIELKFFNHPSCLKEETYFTNDTLNGYHITYFHLTCDIAKIESLKDGILQGSVKKYHPNGQLAYEASYDAGKLTAPPVKYKKTGKKEKAPTPIEKTLDDYANERLDIEDSIVLRSLQQMHLDRHTLVVTDVTGSMTPYVGQLLLWYKLNMRKTQLDKFVFFNDGDEKPDLLKTVGRTGGIYYSNPRKLKELKEIMEKTITAGNGGSEPENDLEAIIKGTGRYRGTRQVVLIADRQSHVRDITLLYKIKVPVHVILCGPEGYLNPQYLDIARQTGGNLYTLDETIRNIKGIREGEGINIAGRTYKFYQGRFVMVNKE